MASKRLSELTAVEKVAQDDYDAFATTPAEAARLKARVFEALKPHMDGAAVRLAAVPLCAAAHA